MTSAKVEAARAGLDPAVADAAEQIGVAIADALELGRRAPERLPLVRALLSLLRNAGDGLAGAQVPLALARSTLRRMRRLDDAEEPVDVAVAAVALARYLIVGELALLA